MSGFLPSAEIKKTGLDEARVGLQMISSGVDARETPPRIRLVQVTKQ